MYFCLSLFGHVAQWPLLGMLSWCPLVHVDCYVAPRERVPLDEIYSHSILAWVAMNWIEWWGDAVAVGVMAAVLHAQITFNDMYM